MEQKGCRMQVPSPIPPDFLHWPITECWGSPADLDKSLCPLPWLVLSLLSWRSLNEQLPLLEAPLAVEEWLIKLCLNDKPSRTWACNQSWPEGRVWGQGSGMFGVVAGWTLIGCKQISGGWSVGKDDQWLWSCQPAFLTRTKYSAGDLWFSYQTTKRPLRGRRLLKRQLTCRFIRCSKARWCEPKKPRQPAWGLHPWARIYKSPGTQRGIHNSANVKETLQPLSAIMSFNCSTRNCSSRPVGGRYSVPAGPVATTSTREADCLSGIYLPSSFQTGSWLLDHCQESCCEPSACQPTCYQRTSCISTPVQVTCNRQTTCVSNPCSTPCSRPLTFVSSGCQSLGGISSSCQPVGGISTTCQPVGGISTVCQPVGGISTICQPTCGVTRTYQQSCVSSCRRTC